MATLNIMYFFIFQTFCFLIDTTPDVDGSFCELIGDTAVRPSSIVFALRLFSLCCVALHSIYVVTFCLILIQVWFKKKVKRKWAKSLCMIYALLILVANHFQKKRKNYLQKHDIIVVYIKLLITRWNQNKQNAVLTVKF